MPTKQVVEYIYDTPEYRAHWGVSRKAGAVILSLPLVAVALIILTLWVVN